MEIGEHIFLAMKEKILVNVVKLILMSVIRGLMKLKNIIVTAMQINPFQ